MIEISDLFLAPQGEGPNLGRLSLFVRTRRCTLHCSWCDTAYTWDRNDPGFQEYETYETPEALTEAMLARTAGSHAEAIVLTGGEPLIWQRQLQDALSLYLYKHTVPIEIETSGTIVPSFWIAKSCQINFSHKLGSAGNRILRDRLWRKDAVIAALKSTKPTVFKPVIDPSGEDVAELQQYLAWLYETGREAGWSEQQLCKMVYLMPRADDRWMLLRNQEPIIDLAAEYGVRYTTRAHMVAYGAERGR